MREPKYIVVEDYIGELVIMGPNYVNHSDMVPRHVSFDKVVSAGFFSIGEDEVSAFGESVSLKVKSRPEDKNLLNQALRLGQYRHSF